MNIINTYRLQKALSILLILSTLLFIFSAQAEDTFSVYARHNFDGKGVVGGAVIISRNGEILCSYTHGYRRNNGSGAVSLDTCFRVASVTKMVTAIGLLHLLEEENISPDTPLSDLLGVQITNPAYPDTPITIRQLLTHTTGFASMNSYKIKWDKLIQDDGKVFLKKTEPGTVYSYSNLNGGLMGSLIEAISGKSLNTYMTEVLFEPLGINAAYNTGLLKDTSDISNRMYNDGTLLQSAKAAIKSLKNYDDTVNPMAHIGTAVGSLYISVRGLDRIMSMIANGGEIDGIRILSEETIQQMLTSQNFPGSSVQIDGDYTLGLARVEGMTGGTWYGHQGRIDGITVNTYYQPDTGMCVSVIANGYKPNLTNHVVNIARVFMEYAQTLLPE